MLTTVWDGASPRYLLLLLPQGEQFVATRLIKIYKYVLYETARANNPLTAATYSLQDAGTYL